MYANSLVTTRMVLLFLALFFVACVESRQGDRVEMEKTKFENIVFDVEVAGESVASMPVEWRDSLYWVYIEEIAKRHGLTGEQLLKTIEERLEEDDGYEEVYDGLLSRIDSLVQPNATPSPVEDDME